MKRNILLPLLVLLTCVGICPAQEQPFTLRLTFGHGDEEASQWTGSVSVRHAKVDGMEGWLFLEPDRLSLNTFDLLTGGLLQKGVTLTGQASPSAQLSVTASRGSFAFDFFDMQLGDRLQFLDGSVEVERLPDAVKLTDDSRDDDYPSIVASGDGTTWAVWQSYSGQKDEVRIAQYDGKWKHFTPLPGGSGDVWRPQVVLDSKQRPAVVWSQQVKGNFDLYARTFDPEANQWLEMVRLSTHPFPDIDHHLVSDRAGHLWVVWQGFRGDNSDIFLRHFDGSGWSGEIQVTSDPANDWVPRMAVDGQGRAHIVWDSYRNGNYDVYLRSYENGHFGPEIPIAQTPKFEAHPSVAVDARDRIWVAWEESGPNWGKDLGPTVDPNWREMPPGDRIKSSPGIGLYDSRNVNLVVRENGLRKTPTGGFHPTEKGIGDNYDSPQVLIDPITNRVGMLLDRRAWSGPKREGAVYWESVLTFYEDGAWTPLLPMPGSWGRITARPAADYDQKGNLWVVWPTDERRFKAASEPVVGNLFTTLIPLDGSPGAPLLAPEGESEEIEVRPGHVDEPGDVRAIRSYRTFVGGVEQRIVRGDFHRHTELSTDLGGWWDGSLHDFYRYVLDAAALDFGAVTDHFAGGNYEYWWWLSEKSCDMYQIPRSFTTFYAYERSARFPHGHRNIIHTRRGVPVLRYFTEVGFEGPGLGGGNLTADDTKLLYESLRKTGGISIPHTSTADGMGTDWRDNDPAVEPVVEIFQGIRVSSEHAGAPRAARSADDRPEGGYQEAGLVWNAYAKGYRIGTIASSDHVSGHISYAMVYTEQPTREAIFEAIRKRHTYGATDNIILDYRMGENFMGEEFSTSQLPPLEIRVVGTSRVSQVDIIKNQEIIYTANPDAQEITLTFVDQDATPGTSYYYIRVLQDDRQIAWSSPIWVNYQP